MLRSDLIFYPMLWITVASPVIWFLLFLLIRRRNRSKKLYFIMLAVYSVMLLLFTYRLSTATGFPALDWLDLGIMVIGPYTFFSSLCIIGVKMLLKPKR
jgi:hypothetical protein